MASSRKDDGPGCIGAAIGLLILIAIVVYAISGIGHLLGLTPTGGEVTDKPDGWVSRHYQGVAVGYVLTVLFVLLIVLLVWLMIRSGSDNEEQAARGRYWLSRAAWVGGALVLAIIVLPIGKRSDAKGNVPNVLGMSAAAAQDRLDKANLDANLVDTPTDDDHCKVVRQRPGAGADLDESEQVDLRCRVRVPRLVGRKADSAESRLVDVGLSARFVNEPSDGDTSRCRVKRQRPTRTARPESDVSLRLRCKKPPPEPPPPKPDQQPQQAGGNCDPNYAGACVPTGQGDVNCPDVGGPVRVVGSDPDGLDRDGDGIGCE